MVGWVVFRVTPIDPQCGHAICPCQRALTTHAAFGVEGTGSYGAGLTWAVRRAGHRVVEVNRGDRRTRRTAGTSDTIDAEVAARSGLAGQSTATPKTADGVVEMMRQLKIVRDTAVKARTAAMITLKPLVVHAPPQLREALQARTDHRRLTRCAARRPGPLDTPAASVKHTLRSIARRWFTLAEEITTHDRHLTRLTTETSPSVRGEYQDLSKMAIGIVAGTLLYVAAPLDLLPDLLPGVGFIDDFAVIAFAVNVVRKEIEHFRLWRGRKTRASADAESHAATTAP